MSEQVFTPKTPRLHLKSARRQLTPRASTLWCQGAAHPPQREAEAPEPAARHCPGQSWATVPAAEAGKGRACLQKGKLPQERPRTEAGDAGQAGCGTGHCIGRTGAAWAEPWGGRGPTAPRSPSSAPAARSQDPQTCGGARRCPPGDLAALPTALARTTRRGAVGVRGLCSS